MINEDLALKKMMQLLAAGDCWLTTSQWQPETVD
jgi:hypothetical protein